MSGNDGDVNSRIHEGHRERLKERFLHDGLDNFSAHEALELLLFYAIPRKDTNPIAHRLINYFDGSFSQVLDAPVEELQKVEGITKNTAILIKMLPEILRKYLMDLTRDIKKINSSSEAARMFMPFFITRRTEAVAIICLDAKGKVLFCNKVADGSVNATEVNIRRIIEIAVRYNTSAVIMAHNHPSGLAVPSEEDISVTEKIIASLNFINIHLLDHIIVTGNDNDWVSLAASPTLIKSFNKKTWFKIDNYYNNSKI